MKIKKKKLKAKATVEKKDIIELYYMIPEKTDVKSISGQITSIDSEKIEIWKELDLMEVVLEHDSLIFQNAAEAFEDPLDLEFMQENHIQTVYQLSYEKKDHETVKKVLGDILNSCGGMLCSDTEDFAPVFTGDNLQEF